ncbi:MAG TPA: hypothetical protein PKD18_24765, partial [Saprospiraceae bacterium]|nr:hypothetical protein [Saprospiraceae bacterium]
MKQKIILFCAIITLQAHAQIRLPKLISDNMVLQRDQPIKIWGWASPKEKIELSFNKKKYKTTTSDDGKWELMLPSQPAGTGHEFLLKGQNDVTIKNIAFGDVFLCIGQSNMVHQMDIHNITYAKDIETANYPEIRHLFIPTRTNLLGKQNDFSDAVAWKSANP